MRAVPSPRHWLGPVLHGLFPPVCPGCGGETWDAHALCAACWRETVFIDAPGCRHCARPIGGLVAPEPDMICDTCSRYPPRWDRGRAVVHYGGTGRRLVLGLKHGDRLDMVPMLGRWMLRAGRALIADADLIAPVPLHWTRRVRRRYNQSAELARWICRHTGRQGCYAPDLLRRCRKTPSQEGKDRAARAANLAGALGPGRGARRRVAGRRVLIIDDVLTTGATLNAASAVLHEAGALAVDILVVALVIGGGSPYVQNPSDEDVDETS